jgi:hypothetical protein
LNGIGGAAVGSADVNNRWARIVVFAAGPVTQLLLGGLCWALSHSVLQLVPRSAPYREALAYALICLQSVSLFVALLNLLPVRPLDGWHIAREVYCQFRGIGSPPWELDANSWKWGARGSEYRQHWHVGSTRGSNLLPFTILLAAAVMAFAWEALGRRLYTPTATQLMQSYKSNPDRANPWQIWPVTFRGVLRKPPWEEAVYQYGGGEEAMVYFATDNPDEWIFCTTEYDDQLAGLQEGRQYYVSGVVYSFEPDGKLFLARCSLRKAE